MSFAELNLISEIQRAITEQGYTEATPIQASAIPAAKLAKEKQPVLPCLYCNY
jgi:superfamily II DNA/RNA helicase